MNSRQPIASLSLDLDNRWSYLKVHGDPEWQQFPSYLDVLIPRVLDFLGEWNLRITFFVVGQDAAFEINHRPLRMISAAGHELGNHSFSHEPWFHLYSQQRVESEIALAEDLINKVTGQRPVGYRAPGFSLTESTLQVLEKRGYTYDASTFPTFIGPLARLYYLSRSGLTGRGRAERSLLFGSLSDGIRPLRPYRWPGRQGIVEIPVSTMPLFRTPIHLSYLLYLSRFSFKLAVNYFRAALQVSHHFSLSPSLLLHPLDFLGVDDKVGLEFFPAMELSAGQKRQFVSEILRVYCNEFTVVPVKEHAATVLIGKSGSLGYENQPSSFTSLTRHI